MQMNTRYLLGNARVGSNPAGRETFSLFSSLSGEVASLDASTLFGGGGAVREGRQARGDDVPELGRHRLRLLHLRRLHLFTSACLLRYRIEGSKNLAGRE